jgi:hypothetical protein
VVKDVVSIPFQREPINMPNSILIDRLRTIQLVKTFHAYLLRDTKFKHRYITERLESAPWKKENRPANASELVTIQRVRALDNFLKRLHDELEPDVTKHEYDDYA